MTKEKQTKKQLLAEIFRFLLVGGGATVVDYLVFWLFDGVIFPVISPNANGGLQTLYLTLATALGFCAGLTVNWILSVRFVFRNVTNEAEVRTKKSFLVFTVIGVIGLVITEVGMLGLVAVLPEFALFKTTTFMGVTWAKWLAKAIMTAIVLVWNYVGRKLFVFK